MSIVGLNFKKIAAEKQNPIKGKLKVNNNVTILDVKEKPVHFSKEQSGVEFNFEFVANYEPDIGYIKLEGEIIIMEDAKKVKEIVEDWNKDKKIEKTLMTKIMNGVLTKSQVQALIISKDINLPPPVNLPKVQAK